MKVSSYLIEVLKNFSILNPGLLVRPGKILRTISTNKTVLAQAEVDQEFEQEFCVGDLSKVLGLLSLEKGNPEIFFEKDSLVYTGLDGTAQIKQRFTEPKLIISPPDKNINVEYTVAFDLSEKVLDWILEVASILSSPNIEISSYSPTITISALDAKGHIVDNATVATGELSNVKFRAILKIENLQILGGAYKVEISPKGVCRFSHKTKKIFYFISLEQKESEFGE